VARPFMEVVMLKFFICAAIISFLLDSGKEALRSNTGYEPKYSKGTLAFSAFVNLGLGVLGLIVLANL